MSAYAQLLRDPRWQRRRLEIMQRDDFRCRECGDAESTLNVHHRRYLRGHKPWEYDDADLVTLCEPCHDEAQAEIAELHALVGALDFISRPIAFGFLSALARQQSGGSAPPLDDAIPITDLFELDGLARYFGLVRDDVLSIAGAPPMQQPTDVAAWLRGGHAVSFRALRGAARCPASVDQTPVENLSNLGAESVR